MCVCVCLDQTGRVQRIELFDFVFVPQQKKKPSVRRVGMRSMFAFNNTFGPNTVLPYACTLPFTSALRVFGTV